MKPWSKLWRRESGRFRALPLAARAIAAYVLKFVDAEGRLPIGRRDPVTAVALAVAADTGERRWLKQAVEALLAHGYLVVEDGDLVVANYPTYQDDGATRDRRPRDAKTTPTEREADVLTTSTRRDSNASATRLERETDARIDSSTRKDTSAQNVLSQREEKREEKGEEKRESARASSPVSSLAEHIRAGYASHFERALPTQRLPREACGLTAPVWAELAREVGDAATADRLLDAAFADDFVVRSGFKPNAIRSERVRLLAHGPARPRGAAAPAGERKYVEDLGEFGGVDA